MISYHGGPITPEKVAKEFWTGKHAMVSFAYPDQLGTALHSAESVACDNGAFTFWKSGNATDWDGYYAWIESIFRHPGFDFALIPDVIDGTENENDSLAFSKWPFSRYVGVPVWHMHESITRLEYLCSEFPRVALGSSGQWSMPGTNSWWSRIALAMDAVCDEQGQPRVKLHGLRMLNSDILRFLPLSSADSTNVARNIGIDSRWKGTYPITNKAIRAEQIADQMKPPKYAVTWSKMHIQDQMMGVYEVSSER